MEDAKRESENPKNEKNPHGHFGGTSHKECVCLGEWMRSENKILNFNNILKREFPRAIQTALE